MARLIQRKFNSINFSGALAMQRSTLDIMEKRRRNSHPLSTITVISLVYNWHPFSLVDLCSIPIAKYFED